MSGERAIIPQDRDYRLLDGADFERCETVANEVYKRICQVQGESPLEPEIGRPLRERLKDIDDERRMILDDCRAALKPMIEEGRAASITVSEGAVDQPQPGRLPVVVEVVDAGGRATTYNLWVEVA